MRRLAPLLLLGLSACPNKKADIAPITTEGEAIKKNEADLLSQRGALGRERRKLSEARAEIVEKRKQLGHDSVGQAALDEEDKKLIAKENELHGKESELDGKLDELLKQQGALLAKATQVVASAPGADPLERAAAREKTVASREKDVAEREKDVAQRERELAERETKQARREKEMCGGPAAPVAIDLPKGLKYSSKDVEPIYKKALKIMADKGVLAADLPPGQAKLVDEVREAMKKGDYVRAKYDADALYAAVDDIKIDRAFIFAKMARLNSTMKGRKFDGEKRKEVESHFREATVDYGDGKFPSANAKINKLFSILR
jgi:hypothetical protein